MNLTDCLKTVSCACLLPAALLFGADDTTPAIRRPSLGFRIEYFASPMFSTSTVQASTTKPVADYTYTGSTPGPRAGLAPMVEYRLTKHLSLGVELHRSEEHTSELQSLRHLVCRLLLEKKN